MAKIVSLGSALQDIFLVDRDDFSATNLTDGHSVFKQLEIGSKIDIDSLQYFTGGGGTNSATTFARYGHEAYYLGNLAHDAAGEAILAALDEERINNSFVQFIDDQHTGCSIVLLDAISGERTILTHRGASVRFDNFQPEILDQIHPDWLYVSTMGGDLDTLAEFLARAAEIGCEVMWNPGARELAQRAEVLKLLPQVDILIVNQLEATQLVDGANLTELLINLKTYTSSVIITAGPAGAVASFPDANFRLGLYESVLIRDTTGAGDAFGSGFLAHFAAHGDYQSALTFGSANSTSVVQYLGAKAGLLTSAAEIHAMPIEQINL